MKVIISYIGMAVLGALGATARYLQDVKNDKKPFSFYKWFMSMFIGVIVAVLTGFLCNHLQLGIELTYALVGAAAISAKEILTIIPDLMVKIVNKSK